MAFERFAAAFEPSGERPVGSQPWRDPILMAVPTYATYAESFCGITFDLGLYRVHDARSGPKMAQLVNEAFPAFAHRVRAFAYDWLGRHFALDTNRMLGGQPQVLLLEPGTGEALEIPYTFEAFHAELDQLREPALAESFFQSWKQDHAEFLPLKLSACVGYQVPLFLGGKDVISNLEVLDIEVYWAMCGQLRLGTQNLPDGTTVRGVSTVED